MVQKIIGLEVSSSEMIIGNVSQLVTSSILVALLKASNSGEETELGVIDDDDDLYSFAGGGAIAFNLRV